MRDFFEFQETGKLVIEKVLFTVSYPVLFTCRSSYGELFLCVCCQSNAEGNKWLLAETAPQVIIQMLTDKLTIREAFLKTGKKRFSILQKDEAKLIAHDPYDWDAKNSACLPDAGEYMEAEEREFEEELSFYEKQTDGIVYDTSVVVSISENFTIISQDERMTTYDWKFDWPQRVAANTDSYSELFCNMRMVESAVLEKGDSYGEDFWRTPAA